MQDPSLEGLFLDARPSDPNVGFGLEHADSPALISQDDNGISYAKIQRMQFPVSGEDHSILMNRVSVYSQDALWNNMESWFNGGPIVLPELQETGTYDVSFINNGGSLIGEISENGQNGLEYEMDLSFMGNIQQTTNTMGYSFDLD